MDRIYDELLKSHFKSENKIAFVSGPRQVGKTTSSRKALQDALYLNWDAPEHRSLILKGPEAVFGKMGGNILAENRKYVIFDEIHKFPRWRNFLKGFFDLYNEQSGICVTGSARLSAFRYGGDSLMGRYFSYRMHPVTFRESVSSVLPNKPISPPVHVPEQNIQHLFHFGGFPEPYIRGDTRFYNRWSRQRLELLFKEDLRDLTHISDSNRVRTLADMLADRSGGLLNYSNIAGDLQVSVDTVRRWIETLEEMYYCFLIRPWSRNVARSLLREPKVFLWDWSMIKDEAARYENLVASHLLKAAHILTDMGFGTFALHYLRDKQKREVDFLMTRDEEPWFLVEAKMNDGTISESLHYFQHQLNAPFAFQAVCKMPYVNKDCFSETRPIAVPGRTLLSQLL